MLNQSYSFQNINIFSKYGQFIKLRHSQDTTYKAKLCDNIEDTYKTLGLSES